MKNKDKAILASSLNIVAAIWLIFSPFFLGFSGTAAATNAVIIGIIVAILALIRVFSPLTTGWLSWVNTVLGVWMIISPAFIASPMTLTSWNNSIVGIIIAVLAIWSAQSASVSMRLQ